MNFKEQERRVNLDETGFGIIHETAPRAYTPAHWHRALELVYFIQGSVICKFSNGSFHGEPGQLQIINSQDVHETRCSRDAKYLVVHILPSTMCRFVPNFDMLRFSLAHSPDDPDKEEAYSALKNQMELLHRQLSHDPDGLRLEQHARLFDAAALLVKHFSTPLAPEEAQRVRSDRSRLEPLLEYIQLHHSQELSLDWAADCVGLAKEYFCRLFKKNMGISYLQYLNQVRAAAVCNDLEVSDDPIGEIGLRHGFHEPKRLNQCFRELYGCTPSEKRKLFRENRG